MFKNIISIFALFVSLLLIVPLYVTAQEATTTNYKNKTKEGSRQIRENFEKAVVPISNSLGYLLTRTLPEADGKPRPLGIRIEPTDPFNPDEPVQVVFSCQFGRQICEPFFEACARLDQKCSSGP